MKKMRNLFLLVFFIPVLLGARPMFIDFDEMIARCKTICIAEYLGSSQKDTKFKLRIESVLKGNEDGSTIIVNRASGNPYLEKHKRFIAFINEKNALAWGGFAEDLETEMIHLKGFYDYNAYFISPSGITLAQLKQYLAEKKFDGSMEGNLEFFNYQAQLHEKTETSFFIRYTYYSNDSIEKKISWKGLQLIDFSDSLTFHFWGNGLQLEFESNMIRPFSVNGFVDSVYADGKTCRASFEVVEPANLSKADFDKYLSHPEYGPPYYEIEITLNDTGKYMYYYNFGWLEDYLQYGNRKIKSKGCGPPTRDEKGEFHFGEGYSGTPDEIMIVIDSLPNEPRYKSYTGSGSIYFVPGLKNGGWQGDWFQMENGKMVLKGRCTIRLKSVQFNPNRNFKK